MSSLYFDGSSTYIEVDGLPSPANNGGDVSIEFWSYVKQEDRGEGTAFGFRSESSRNRTSSHAPWSYQLIWDCGNWGQGGRLSTGYTDYFDKWVHVVLVARGSTSGSPYQAIYLNGALAVEQDSSSNVSPALTDLFIGCANEHTGGRSDFHKGWLGRFRVWSKALTVDEARTNMTRALSGTEEGLVLAFDLDGSPDETSVTNLVAGGPNGTLHNFPSTSPAPPVQIPATEIPAAPSPVPTSATGPTVVTVNVDTRPAIPAGLKTSFKTGPNSPYQDRDSTTCDTLNYNGKTYWAYSYQNNNVKMCIVAYDSSGNNVGQLEKLGARYLWKITVESEAQTVTFHGQSSKTITIPWSELP